MAPQTSAPSTSSEFNHLTAVWDGRLTMAYNGAMEMSLQQENPRKQKL